jgi:hypothetical protein
VRRAEPRGRRAAHRGTALADFARSIAVWARLALSGRVAAPRAHVGARLRFADGTTSRVFRETLRRGAATPDPAVLVIGFRLAPLGRRPRLHAAFRRECVVHTPLFAGFPGFRSKLWVTDERTGVYRGIYEWQDAAAARRYAQRMVGLLAPFSTPGTARFHLVAGLRRDDYLADPANEADRPDEGWWRLAEPMDHHGRQSCQAWRSTPPG